MILISRQELIEKLIELNYLTSEELEHIVKPTHGECCTCQDCGYKHDDCVCFNNELLTMILELDERDRK